MNRPSIDGEDLSPEKWVNYLANGEPDFVICLENFKLYCHKNVLKKASSYFSALMSSEMIESKECKVTLNQVEKAAFLTLCEFAYSGKLNISDKNMFQIAELSSMYHFEEALRHSEIFIQSKISSESWSEILIFAELHHLERIFNSAFKYILWYFPQEASLEFKNLKALPCAMLSRILSHQLLHVSEEIQVVKAIESWMMENSTLNHEDKVHLFKSTVYLDDCSENQLEEISQIEFIRKSKFLLTLVEENKRARSDTQSLKIPSQRRYGPFKILLVGGDVEEGEVTNPSKDIFQIDVQTGNMEPFSSLDQVCSTFRTNMGYRACSIDGCIYLSGGEAVLGRNSWQYDVWKYSCFDKLWSVVTTLLQPRRHHGICVLDEEMYLIGGIGKYREILTSVEKYNPSTGEWTSLTSMRIAEYWPAVTACNRRIYVMKNSIQSYCPVADQWTPLNVELPFDLGFHSAVTVDDYIYMKCQYDGRVVCLKTNNRSLIADTVTMFDAAPNGQLVSVKGTIYCIGGMDSTHIQCYHLSTQTLHTLSEFPPNITSFNLIVAPNFPSFI